MENNKTINWEKIKIGLSKYEEIMKLYKNSENLIANEIFRRKFKGFYKLRRNDVFCDFYFKILQDNRHNKTINFKSVLSSLYEKSGRVEASFSSKLIATIDPDLPVWDSIVLKNLENHLMIKFSSKDKIERTIDKYEALKGWYNDNLSTPQYQGLIKVFDEKFPDNNISNLKKIDLILWQSRS